MMRSLFSLPRLPSSFSSSSSRNIFSCKMSTTPPPPLCPNFVAVQGADIDSTANPHGIRFRLVSYNILAQVIHSLQRDQSREIAFDILLYHDDFSAGPQLEAFVKSAFFPHSPSPCLKWKARSKAVLTVLKNLGADFLCLQELDEYDSFYKKNIESWGYSSIYIQRSGQKRDGCGIFYKESCAELLLEERIEYNDLVDCIQDEPINSNDKDAKKAPGSKKETKNEAQGLVSKSIPVDRGDPNDPRVRLKRDCVGIMAAFRIKHPFHHIIIVANTHIYWDPEWADVKLAQAKYLLSRLAHFKTLISDKFEGTPSVIVSGDFNSTPGDKVYQYLVSGSSPSAEVECSDELPIPLCSAYGSRGGEPAFTNCTPDFTNTLDYVFFSPSDQIKPVSLLELPEAESVSVSGGLPNYYHPSDHLPIGVEFEIIS